MRDYWQASAHAQRKRDMDRPQVLLTRLDAMGAALAQEHDALALIGLGSVGTDLERLDACSDLDIFVIVAPGHKQRFINDLSWLEAVHPIAYAFLNSAHGYKLLFTDGVYCELDVFEPQELAATHFPRGRFVWKRPEVDDGLAVPQALPPAARGTHGRVAGGRGAYEPVRWPGALSARREALGSTLHSGLWRWIASSSCRPTWKTNSQHSAISSAASGVTSRDFPAPHRRWRTLCKGMTAAVSQRWPFWRSWSSISQ